MSASYKIARRATRKVYVGEVAVGGGAPISVQTMTNAKTADVKAVLEQIAKAKEAGADIVRLAANDKEAADALGEIVAKSPIPVVADIHFNHVFALKAIKAGVAKVRINPGNIGSEERIKEVLTAARERGVPIRIGVNSGSLENDILEKRGYPTAEALCESAERHVRIAEKFGFEDLIVSIKSTSVRLTIEANRLFAQKFDYPVHLGVTEAGLYASGSIKSAVGIGTLLAEGIGDTIRVSLTDEPWKEIEAAKNILKALELTARGVEIISCPTCGRIEIDLIKIASQLERKTKGIDKNVKVALLGCAVNGIGEAREADIGIAGGKGEALFFKKGRIVGKIKEENIVDFLVEEIKKF